MFAFGGGFQVVFRFSERDRIIRAVDDHHVIPQIGDEMIKIQTGVHFFVIRGFAENLRNLLKSFRDGLFGVIRVAAARLRFPCERFHQVFCGFRAFERCHASSPFTCAVMD